MSEQNSINQDIEQLVERYLDDPRPDLKDLIMVQCASMVERIARRFSGIEAFDDLVQVGYIGLLNALGKFDRTAGVKFNTYATYLVAGEIKPKILADSNLGWLTVSSNRPNDVSIGKPNENNFFALDENNII